MPAALALLALTACSSDDTVVDYTGYDASYVRACAAIAAHGDLRDDAGVASRIEIADVTSEQRIEGGAIYYDVSGHTYVWGANPDGSGRRDFAWTCVVNSDAGLGEIASLTATLTHFEREE